MNGSKIRIYWEKDKNIVNWEITKSNKKKEYYMQIIDDKKNIVPGMKSCEQRRMYVLLLLNQLVCF